VAATKAPKLQSSSTTLHPTPDSSEPSCTSDPDADGRYRLIVATSTTSLYPAASPLTGGRLPA